MLCRQDIMLSERDIKMFSCANKILSRSNNILSCRNELKNKTRMSLPGFRRNVINLFFIFQVMYTVNTSFQMYALRGTYLCIDIDSKDYIAFYNMIMLHSCT